MNIKVKSSSGDITILNDKSYLSSGGEGSIYVVGNRIYKIFHDNKRIIPLKKIKELSVINNNNVITPKDMIYNISTGSVIGYTTVFISDANPLVKYFTKTFKDDNNINYSDILSLIKKMQIITMDIHKGNCLIVDYNELNILVKEENKTLNPFYIDCDSYQTPSYKSSAIMKSIMDRRVTNYINGKLIYNPDEMSDWFSWGILSFNILTNIHPFRASHPNYKPTQKEKQMDDNISVFDLKSKVPPMVTPFSNIPKKLLDWYKFIFSDIKNRSIPPLPDSNVPLVVPTQIVTIQGTDKIDINEVVSYDDQIMTVFPIMGVYYAATKKYIYANKKEIGNNTAKKILFCAATDGTVITAQQDISNKISFKDLTKSELLGTATSNNMFSRNNCIYTIIHGKLVENSFIAFSNKIIPKTIEIENLSVTSSTMHLGCIIQDLLGKIFLTIPYKSGSCFSKYISQLDGYRVISAKSDKNVTVVLAEKLGKYDRFIIIFDKNFTKFDVRKVEDVAYDTIMFAVLDNGLCALLASPTELELFSSVSHCEVLNNPPFDSTMNLFASTDGFFIINGNSLHQIKKK